MRQLRFLILLGMLSSCHNDFHSPADKEIEQAIINMYEKRSQADGAGGWIVNEVKVLKKLEGRRRTAL